MHKTNSLANLLFLILIPIFGLASGKYSIHNIPSILLKESNAVVREDVTLTDITNLKKMKVYQKKVTSILHEDGKKHGQVIIHYNSSMLIHGLKIVIFDQHGKKVKEISDSYIDDLSASGNYTLYDDTRAKIFIPKYQKIPYTISYEYSYETKNTLLLPNWYPINNYGVSLESSQYTYNAPPGFPVRIKEKNIGTQNIHIDQRNVIFKAKNIPSIGNEEYGPTALDLFPYIMVSPERFYYEGVKGSFTNWKEYGQWVYQSLLENRDSLSTSIKDEVNSLLKGTETPYEKAKKIYEYVQQNTDYINISYGINGIMPLEAERVHALKYGDCKALTNYTQALLKAVGINSIYTEVFASNDIKKNYENDFASITQGNHIILCIPQNRDTVWVDCTSDELPFGYVGSMTDDRKALIITEEGGKIVSTPKYTAKDNKRISKTKIIIDDHGKVYADISIQNYGLNFYDKIALKLPNNRRKEEKVRAYFPDYFGNVDLTSYSISIDNNKVLLNEELSIVAERMAERANNYMLFPTAIFTSSMSTPKHYKERTQDIIIKRGFTHIDVSSFSYPFGFAIDSKPMSQTIDSRFGKYHISTSFGGKNVLNIKREFKIKAGKYGKENYKDFRAFIEKINTIESQKIILKKH